MRGNGSWGLGSLFAFLVVGAAASACSTSVNLFSDESVGAGGRSATGTGGGAVQVTVTTTGVGGGATTTTGGGGEGGCNDDDCAIDAVCLEGICGPDDTCITQPVPPGTPCGDEGAVCDGQGLCQRPDGSPCTQGGECLSFFCVDGVCCESQCADTCSTCAATGTEGMCTLHEVGTDPDMECKGGSCTGEAECATGLTVWAQTYGNGFEQLGHEVDVDSSGNAIITGYHYGSIDFGGGAISSNGNRDVYLAKIDPMGNHLWSFGFGNQSSQWGWDVAVDGSDDIVVGGYFYGQVNFGGSTLTAIGDRDAFIAKFDSAGNHLFSARFGDSQEDLARTVAVGPNGEMAVAGYFENAINFGGGTLNSAGFLDIFVAVFDSAGNHVWSDSFGSPGDDRAYDLVFDATGNLYVTGRFSGSVDFGGGALNSAGSVDAFIAKYNPTGGHLWSQRYGDGDDQYIRGVDLDSAGNVVVAGYADGNINLGGNTLNAAGGLDVFVAKLTPAGGHLWSQIFQAPDDQFTRDLVVDADDNVIFTGYGFGAPNFGGGPLTNLGARDSFVVKFNGDGVHLWSRSYGAGSSQYGHGIAVDGTGHVLVTGYFNSGIDFGSGQINSSGQEDVFLARLQP